MKISHSSLGLRHSRSLRVAVLAALALALTSGCSSLQHYATGKLGDALASSGTTYASDDDPELIRGAAPFSLKLMESVLADDPDNARLLTAAASGFTQYAYAFVQQDADEAENRDIAAARALRHQARGLYLRARGYGLRALEVRHPGFGAKLAKSPKEALAELGREDCAALYWTTVAWAASISLGKDSARAIADLPAVDAMVARLDALDPGFDHGAFQSFLVSYEMGRPGARDPQRAAQRDFERAVQLSDGQRASPYVAYAENVCVATQNRREFVAELDRALAIDPNARPAWRLENHVMQRRARWLLTQTDQLFLEPDQGERK
jgi:predicted anti-sigma-YlaC factor YlaD